MGVELGREVGADDEVDRKTLGSELDANCSRTVRSSSSRHSCSAESACAADVDDEPDDGSVAAPEALWRRGGGCIPAPTPLSWTSSSSWSDEDEARGLGRVRTVPPMRVPPRTGVSLRRGSGAAVVGGGGLGVGLRRDESARLPLTLFRGGGDDNNNDEEVAAEVFVALLANGEMQMMLLLLAVPPLELPPCPWGSLATSEKKNEVDTRGVRGGMAAPGVPLGWLAVPPPLEVWWWVWTVLELLLLVLGVWRRLLLPKPGEKRQPDGDCNHAKTLDVSNKGFP